MAATITLRVYAPRTNREFPVKFYGESAEDNALAYVARNGANYVEEYEDNPVGSEFTRLLDALYPLCEHGMSLSLCNGPQHYWYDEEEQARGLYNS